MPGSADRKLEPAVGPYLVRGLLLALALFVSYLLVVVLSAGRLPPLEAEAWIGPERNARVGLVTCALLSFLLTVQRYEERCDTLAALREWTALGEPDFARLRRPVRSGGRRAIWLARAVGLLLGFGVVMASLDPAQALTITPTLAWSLLVNGLLFGVLAGSALDSWRDRAVPDRVAGALGELDLLDRRPLVPFARLGLRRALYWAGGSTVASLLALDLQRVWALALVLAVTSSLATVAFLGPARAIHRRLLDAKEEELARVRARIREAREQALSGDGQAGAGQLPGLLAWEARVQDVSPWPFDTATLVRFAALLLLAVGSWVGGAVVERLLGLAID